MQVLYSVPHLQDKYGVLFNKTVRQKLNTISPILFLLGTFALGSCSWTSPDQRTVVDAIRSIDRYPVSRTKTIRKIGLDRLPSERDGHVINSGSLGSVPALKQNGISGVSPRLWGLSGVSPRTETKRH